MFTKKEVSRLTGIKLNQLDYWAKDQLGIVPQSIGSKYSNVFYSFDQVSELMVANDLKKQGFVTDFINCFLITWRQFGRPLDNYLVKLSNLEEYQKSGYMIVFDDVEYQKRFLNKDDEGVFYLILSKAELDEFMDKVTSFYRLNNLNITRFDITPLTERIKDNAQKSGIDPDRLMMV